VIRLIIIDQSAAALLDQAGLDRQVDRRWRDAMAGGVVANADQGHGQQGRVGGQAPSIIKQSLSPDASDKTGLSSPQ
jgi:hypothetical protein